MVAHQNGSDKEGMALSEAHTTPAKKPSQEAISSSKHLFSGANCYFQGGYLEDHPPLVVRFVRITSICFCHFLLGHLEGNKPTQLGDLMVPWLLNHLLTGMIKYNEFDHLEFGRSLDFSWFWHTHMESTTPTWFQVMSGIWDELTVSI